jgi:hypothetical protein|tara:strand:- start:1149 stop:1415 length:267 start_codon:yes stop_codon:yes gene_type:complete
MTRDFEAKMTVAPGFVINRTNDINDIAEDFGSYPLPQPEDEGWRLKQVIPVHNNTRFLEYFGERELVKPDELYDEENHFKNMATKLKI